MDRLAADTLTPSVAGAAPSFSQVALALALGTRTLHLQSHLHSRLHPYPHLGSGPGPGPGPAPGHSTPRLRQPTHTRTQPVLAFVNPTQRRANYVKLALAPPSSSCSSLPSLLPSCPPTPPCPSRDDSAYPTPDSDCPPWKSPGSPPSPRKESQAIDGTYLTTFMPIGRGLAKMRAGTPR